MKRRHNTLGKALGIAAGFICFGSVVVSCASTEFDCDAYSTCARAGAGGVGGMAQGGSSGTTNAGAPTSGSSNGGMSTQAGMAGTNGEAGVAGAPPCDGKCGGATPVCVPSINTCVECTDKTTCQDPTPACDSTANTCVECTDNPDCTEAAKPFCDKTAEQCVACLQQSDCKAATAATCTAGACAPCTVDADCADITGKGVCSAGTCVQCTVAKESVCAGKSCNPATNQCTTTAVGMADYCQPCLADSECIGGNQADPEARCVPMKFMGVARVGGFCLKRLAKTCSPPFGVPISAGSLSGAASEVYCGIDQSSTRCEAVLDLVASKACADGLDTSCGCTRSKTGTCTDAGQGGLCKTVGAFANTCTIPCGNAVQCTSITTCTSAVSYCH